jgi:ParB/Sulfiredoxin domain
VPESNPSTNEVPDLKAPLGDASSFADLDGPVASSGREGLPPNYRMRADAHYIDLLDSRPSAGHEMLDPAVIDAPAPGDDGELAALVDSIRRHGILQPLLVQNRDGRYRLIAGQKRRRAAMLAGVRRVPCIVHEVSDEDARALGVAAGIRTSAKSPASSPVVDTSSDVSRSLETLLFCANLVTGVPSDLSRGISSDLIGAESWRAFCLVELTRIAQHGAAAGRRLVAPRGVLDRVERSFLAECRLRNVAMETATEIHDGRFVVGDEQLLALALSGAIIATMALFDRAGRSAMQVSVQSDCAGKASFVVGQSSVAMPDTWATRGFDKEWTDRPGGAAATASMLALKRIAEVSGGTASAAFTRRGTTITLTIPMA